MGGSVFMVFFFNFSEIGLLGQVWGKNGANHPTLDNSGIGASHPWGQLQIWASYPRGENSVGPVVLGANHPWGELS